MAIETMRRRDLLNTCAAAPLALAAGRRAFGQNRYQPTWKSIDQRPSPAWYTDSKFGIFIHWGGLLGAGVCSRPMSTPLRRHFAGQHESARREAVVVSTLILAIARVAPGER